MPDDAPVISVTGSGVWLDKIGLLDDDGSAAR
jgi:hypothetical protein